MLCIVVHSNQPWANRLLQFPSAAAFSPTSGVDFKVGHRSIWFKVALSSELCFRNWKHSLNCIQFARIRLSGRSQQPLCCAHCDAAAHRQESRAELPAGHAAQGLAGSALSVAAVRTEPVPQHDGASPCQVLEWCQHCLLQWCGLRGKKLTPESWKRPMTAGNVSENNSF